jgi:hypothetical protein
MSTGARAAAPPAMPAFRATPSEAATLGIAAPIPTGTVPAVGIKAIILPTEGELGLFNGIETGGRRAELSRQRHRLRRARYGRNRSDCRAQRQCQSQLLRYR